MTNWSYLEDFARRFTLSTTTTRPEVRALFEPTVDFAASLIDMIAELDARQDKVTGFDRQNARDNLMRTAQHLIEAVIAALAGMYASGNVIYRLSVEATLRAMYTDAQILSRLGAERREDILAYDWDIGAADYRRVLCQNKGYQEAANRLYTVYRTLSKVAHGSLDLFAGLDQHLHALPRYSPQEAGNLRDLMREGNAAAGILIRKRFRSLFTVSNLERVATFDRAVRNLTANPESGASSPP
jgi:hypothetical protein